MSSTRASGGRAVETTRLSSDAMNRARPVITTAQTVRGLVAENANGPEPSGHRVRGARDVRDRAI